MNCPHCGHEINIGALLGARSTPKKSMSSRENGKKGGRPRIETRTINGRTVRRAGNLWEVMDQRSGELTGNVVFTGTLSEIRSALS